jgi:hypothetical protein
LTDRIVQWTTGIVGKKSVHAVVANADLELVGCYAWSPDKVGRAVGELCGIEPLGATEGEKPLERHTSIHGYPLLSMSK